MNINRLRKSFSYALGGLSYVIKHEQNFRIQLFCAFLVLLCALFFRIRSLEFILLCGAVAMVLILEIINTAIERSLDIVKPRLSEQVKMVKDIMAGAVLIASIFALILAIFIFWPHFALKLSDLSIHGTL